MVKETKHPEKRSESGARRTATDWEEATLDAIASHGLLSLSIPALARTLGVTKGSFYWHFATLQMLIDASLRRWEKLDRTSLEEIREIDDPRARLVALFRQAIERRQAHALYVALSASTTPEVTSLIRRISDRRLKLLVETYEEIGLDRPVARERAVLAYSAYVGALHLRQQRFPGLGTDKDLAAFVAHATKTFIPGRA